VERIGVFGGTFDPIHAGHLVAAVNARHALGLDRVLLVVANQPWQKVGGREVAPAADRLAVVEAASADVDGLEACSIEIDRGGDSFTVDTLEALAQDTGADLYLIVGSDLLGELRTWRQSERIKELATLAVVSRPGGKPAGEGLGPGWRMEAVDIPQLNISSTELRARAADGRPLDFLVPAAAVRCMRQRGMYAVRG